MSEQSFYALLPPIRSAAEALDERHYAPAPGDWFVAFSDIRGSTAAVAAGRHADVNFCAAAMIAALSNAFGAIPYQFGGDGAAALVPPGDGARARQILARARGFARRDFALDLRIALVPVATLAARGASLTVGRYEPIPGSVYALFRGGALTLLENAVKGAGDLDLAALAMIADAEDDGDPPDLAGLSCRWTPVKAARGRMVSLVLRAGDHKALHDELARIAGVPRLNAVEMQGLSARWPPAGLLREARARKGRWPLALMVPLVALETLLAWVVVRFRLKIGGFDAGRYVREVAESAIDFARAGDTLCLVFDCPADRIAAVRARLAAGAASGELRYGMQVSDHAVMTCLVASTSGGHVHFVDGGDGGYTSAATQLKAMA
jgi:Protein of unknown function (DUF3095)